MQRNKSEKATNLIVGSSINVSVASAAVIYGSTVRLPKHEKPKKKQKKECNLYMRAPLPRPHPPLLLCRGSTVVRSAVKTLKPHTHTINCTRVKDASEHTASTAAAWFSPPSPPSHRASKLQIGRRCGTIPSEIFKEGVI